MRVAIIGATGFVGAALVKEAVQRGMEVTAIARNTGGIIENVHKLSLDVNDTTKLSEALKGQDVVLSAFNAGWSNPNLYEDFMAGAKAIHQAVKTSGVKRFIVVGGAGSLFVAEGVQLIDTPEFPPEYKAGASGARHFLNILKQEQELDWAFFSPAIEMHPGVRTGRTGKYRLGTTTPVFDDNQKSRLSVEDLAVVLLDEVVRPKHHKMQFTAAY